ncbi:MAG: hypothetical protein AAF320_04390, partial [Myxococcota bacterium]
MELEKARRDCRKSISLDDYEKNWRGLEKFQNDLQNCLRPYIFSINSMRELIVEALHCIKPVDELIKNQRTCLEKCITEVLEHWSFLRKESPLENITLFQEFIA